MMDNIASDDAESRAKAGSMVARFLRQTQASHLSSQESSGSLSDADSLLCPDLSYTVKRLVRGLSSSRQSARQGFAACLAEILLLFKEVSTATVMTLIEDSTKV